MKIPCVRVLKFAILTTGTLMLMACESVDSAIDNTAEGMDIAMDSLDDSLNTATSMPNSSEDYLKDPCPRIKLVNELGEFYDFSNFRQPNESNLITDVKVRKLASQCTYTDKSVTIDMNLLFEGALGPAARRGPQDTFYSYPYFVAITSPSNVLMARQVFAVPMTYGPGQMQQVHRENLRQVIPIAKPEHGPGYHILIGFQLNKQQLAYNRQIMKNRKKDQAAQDKADQAAMKNVQPLRPRETVIIQQGPGAPPAIAPVQPVSPTPLQPAAR